MLNLVEQALKQYSGAGTILGAGAIMNFWFLLNNTAFIKFRDSRFKLTEYVGGGFILKKWIFVFECNNFKLCK